MPDENKTLEELERMEKLATPAPWESRGVSIYGPDGLLAEFGFGMRDDPEIVESAALSAALRNAYPSLLAQARRAGELERALRNIKADIEGAAAHAHAPNVRTQNRPQAEMAHVYACVCQALTPPKGTS